MSSVTELAILPRQSAVLDEAPVGRINSALGTVRYGDFAPRNDLAAKLNTLPPGVIAGWLLRAIWRMPPLAQLPPRQLTTRNRVWRIVTPATRRV